MIRTLGAQETCDSLSLMTDGKQVYVLVEGKDLTTGVGEEGSGKGLVCSICLFLECKYSHCSQFQVTSSCSILKIS